MNLPAAGFAAVAPPTDGLLLAFTAARRRRNSKAAVSAFGGAVAIASMLSFLAPPGQTLVQEPTQPARGGLLPGVVDAPRHGAPTIQVRTPAAVTGVARPTAESVVVARRPAGLGALRLRAKAATDPCADGRTLACASLPVLVDGGPTGQAKLCPAAASVTVEYDAAPVGPTRVHASRTVEVGGGCRS